MNSHGDLQQNGLESLINDNDRIDTDMNGNLHNGYASSLFGLLNSHTSHQDNESSKLNDLNMSVDNGCVNGDYFYMNSSTVSDIKNHNSVDYTNKIDEISTNVYLGENNGLPDGVDIGGMLPSS